MQTNLKPEESITRFVLDCLDCTNSYLDTRTRSGTEVRFSHNRKSEKDTTTDCSQSTISYSIYSRVPNLVTTTLDLDRALAIHKYGVRRHCSYAFIFEGARDKLNVIYDDLKAFEIRL